MSDDQPLDHALIHLMLGMREDDPEKFAEMCDLLGVDPEGWSEFLGNETKRLEN